MAEPTDIAMNPLPAARASSLRALAGLLVGSALLPGTLALALALLCYAAAGPTLGLYFGGIAVAALLAPPLALGENQWKQRGLVAGSILAGIALPWLAAVWQGQTTLLHWSGAVAVLAGFELALVALGASLVRWHLPATAASAVAVLVGLAWLSWPIWLAPWLTMDGRQRLVADLVAAHPLFSLNGLMLNEFPVPWLQCRLAYILTNIGDDIPYAMPEGIARCLAGHGAAAALLLLSCWKRPDTLPLAR